MVQTAQRNSPPKSNFLLIFKFFWQGETNKTLFPELCTLVEKFAGKNTMSEPEPVAQKSFFH